MQSYDNQDHPGTSNSFFQNPNTTSQSRVSLPPASSFFETSTHSGHSLNPYHGDSSHSVPPPPPSPYINTGSYNYSATNPNTPFSSISPGYNAPYQHIFNTQQPSDLSYGGTDLYQRSQILPQEYMHPGSMVYENPINTSQRPVDYHQMQPTNWGQPDYSQTVIGGSNQYDGLRENEIMPPTVPTGMNQQFPPSFIPFTQPPADDGYLQRSYENSNYMNHRKESVNYEKEQHYPRQELASEMLPHFPATTLDQSIVSTLGQEMMPLNLNQQAINSSQPVSTFAQQPILNYHQPNANYNATIISNQLIEGSYNPEAPSVNDSTIVNLSQFGKNEFVQQPPTVCPQALPTPSRVSSADIEATVAGVIAQQTAQLAEEAREFPHKQPVQKKRQRAAAAKLPHSSDGMTVKEVLKQQQLEKKNYEKQEKLKQKIMEDEEKRQTQDTPTSPTTFSNPNSVQILNDEQQIVFKEPTLQIENMTTNHIHQNQDQPREVAFVEKCTAQLEQIPLTPYIDVQEQKQPQMVVQAAPGSTPTIVNQEMDEVIAARIQEMGGFKGLTVGELAESIEGVLPAPCKRKRTRKPKAKKVVPEVIDFAQKENAEKFVCKTVNLQGTVKSLVLKNTALADEVSRLAYRIQTATEERRILAKRLQHYERNRIRRVTSQRKKRQEKQAFRELIDGDAFTPMDSEYTPPGSDCYMDKYDSADEDTLVSVDVSAYSFDELIDETLAVVMPFTQMNGNTVSLDDDGTLLPLVKRKRRSRQSRNPSEIKHTRKRGNLGENNTVCRKRRRKNQGFEYSSGMELEQMDDTSSVGFEDTEFEEIQMCSADQEQTFVQKNCVYNAGNTTSSSIEVDSRPASRQSNQMATRTRRSLRNSSRQDL